ncbi:hypothetical protein BpHYR1_022745 [Brachionus plicatilis]|uniref:Uncharacterized protein n=1 Tax=Brachionus plicatilis TaxID=10195 RepID=A0A3M7PHX3_BRAPC|nr:hypothetical protein BpHYR1_022745 [Brachionus plicatilis]
MILGYPWVCPNGFRLRLNPIAIEKMIKNVRVHLAKNKIDYKNWPDETIMKSVLFEQKRLLDCRLINLSKNF